MIEAIPETIIETPAQQMQRFREEADQQEAQAHLDRLKAIQNDRFGHFLPKVLVETNAPPPLSILPEVSQDSL